MPQCFVSNCRNYYGKTRGKVDVMYHIFPTKPDLAEKWSVLCGHKKDFKAPPYARVCSDHFSPSCYQRDLQHELLGLPLRKKLKADAIPNKNLAHEINTEKNSNIPLKDRKKTDKVTKFSLDSISNKNKTKQAATSSLQMTNKNVKPHLENITITGASKPKVKPKHGLSRSHSLNKIAINNLCKNKSCPQRRSNPLKETTSNKIEQNLIREVSIESFKNLTKEVTIEPIKKRDEEDFIQPVISKKEPALLKIRPKENLKVCNQVKKFTCKRNGHDNTSDGKEPDKTCKYGESSKHVIYLNKTRQERMPMRSSIRIAKKKSIESLSESFTMKVNSKKGDSECTKHKRFSDKLKFMAKLHLRYLSNKSDLETFLDQASHIIPLATNKR